MYKNILLIKMSSMGDIIHTLPSVYELRRLYPEAKITWIVHPQFGTFVPTQIVDEVIYFDKVKFNKSSWLGKWRMFREMRSILHSRNFDLVIDMQGLLKSAIIALMTGCGNRIGFCDMREGSYWISRPIKGSHAKDHVVQRYLDVVRYLGAEVGELHFPLPDLSADKVSLLQKLADAGVSDKYVVVVPGGRWESKCWPVEYFAKLIEKLVDDGVNVVLAGGSDDALKGKKIAELVGSGNLFNLIGQTNLKELVVLIDNCQTFFSVDTGPLHFAAALNKPLVCMFGPTTVERTGPYGSSRQMILQSPVFCAGCLKKRCDHWNCMHAITPEMVYEAYRKLMEGPDSK